ncbi:MAG: hypothetical protein WCF65_05270 [Parachlamydiaceae bacterium]
MISMLCLIFIGIFGDFALNAQEDAGSFSTVYIISNTASNDNRRVTTSNASFEFQNVISLPLPLSRDFPVTISPENDRKYLKNPQFSARNQAEIMSLLQTKSFPLLHIFAAIIVFAVIILIRLTPDVASSIKEDILSAEQVRIQATEKLENLIINSPQPNESASAFFLRLESALREYLDSTYHLGASTSTSQELATKSISCVDTNLQLRLVGIIQEAESIKFSRKEISEYECHSAVEVVKILLTQN